MTPKTCDDFLASEVYPNLDRIDNLEAGLMPRRDMAVPSTPVAGTPFFELGNAS